MKKDQCFVKINKDDLVLQLDKCDEIFQKDVLDFLDNTLKELNDILKSRDIVFDCDIKPLTFLDNFFISRKDKEIINKLISLNGKRLSEGVAKYLVNNFYSIDDTILDNLLSEYNDSAYGYLDILKKVERVSNEKESCVNSKQELKQKYEKYANYPTQEFFVPMGHPIAEFVLLGKIQAKSKQIW